MNKKVIVTRYETILQEYEYEVIVPIDASKEEILKKVDEGNYEGGYVTARSTNDHFFVDDEHADIETDEEWINEDNILPVEDIEAELAEPELDEEDDREADEK